MSCLTPVTIFKVDKVTGAIVPTKVPCGKCWDCLSRRRKDWSFRLWYENFVSESSWFVTLTYRDECLPVYGASKTDVQKFLKRFRKLVPKFRYFLVSESGDEFGRVHYHFCCFFKEKVTLTQLVRSVSKAWTFGFIQVGQVSFSRINYVSKYSLKPKKDPDYVDENTGLVYPQNRHFCLMSRKPGIGNEILKDSKWLSNHRSGDGQFTQVIEGKNYYLPRYYRNKVFSRRQILLNNKKNEEARIKQESKGLTTFEQQARGKDFLESITKDLFRKSVR